MRLAPTGTRRSLVDRWSASGPQAGTFIPGEWSSRPTGLINPTPVIHGCDPCSRPCGSLPPAQLGGNEPEDAFDGVGVVFDAELVRDREQQGVGSLDRRVAGELLDEDVGFRGV
jgi:hypothetical protein